MPKTAVIVVDMLNRYDHDDADKLAASVREALPQVVELRDRAHASDDVLLVYCNDNFEQWSSTRDDLVRNALEGERPDLVEPIVPPGGVPFLPKGRHSVFYETPLSHLLHVHYWGHDDFPYYGWNYYAPYYARNYIGVNINVPRGGYVWRCPTCRCDRPRLREL